jgi:hypothetical protein
MISNDNIDYLSKKNIKKCPWNNFHSKCVIESDKNIKSIYEYKINNKIYCDRYYHNNIKITIITFTILFITFYLSNI